MLDEREGEVDQAELHRAFNNKSIGQRFAIVIAGPVFNFIFAIFAYWMMFMIGITGLKPFIGGIEKETLAEQAGLQVGDEIIRVNDHRTPTWSAVMDIIVAKVIAGQQVKITVSSQEDYAREAFLDLSQVSVDDMAGGRLLQVLGVHPKRPVVPAVIGKIIKGGAAERTEVLPGDKIIAVNGKTIKDWVEWVKIIRENPGKTLNVELLRNGEPFIAEIIPDSITTEEGKQIGRIGAVVDNNYTKDNSLMAIESYSFVHAFFKAFIKTGEMSMLTLRILGKMIIGEVSVKNLSGPISIAQYAGHSAGLGLVAFLGFLAIVSVSLGVLNLLPIPLLDGGHLMYYLIEVVKGSPVSETMQGIGQQVGLAVLLGLMGVAFYNDILRLMN